jgi:hypothetical protein
VKSNASWAHRIILFVQSSAQPRRRLLAGVWLATLAGALAAGAPARAGNADKPRVPAEFPGAPCMVVVDRAVDPVLHIDDVIPEEDLGPLTADEVADSRRMQFFAFGRDFAYLPGWIADADVEAAAALDLVEVDAVPQSQILEHDLAWADGAWTRITPDDARLPIDFVTAAAGVDWDTSGVEAGTWMIAAYTWEPPQSLWSRRAGVVRVVDGADDLEAAPPSVALEPLSESAVAAGAPIVITGCLAAMPGSTLTLSWEVVGGDESGVSYEGELDPGAFELSVAAPTPAEPLALVRLRARIEDPLGRHFEALSPDELQVEASAIPPRGDGCRVTREGAPPVLVAVVWLLLGRPRRRVYCAR